MTRGPAFANLKQILLTLSRVRLHLLRGRRPESTTVVAALDRIPQTFPNDEELRDAIDNVLPGRSDKSCCHTGERCPPLSERLSNFVREGLRWSNSVEAGQRLSEIVRGVQRLLGVFSVQ